MSIRIMPKKRRIFSTARAGDGYQAFFSMGVSGILQALLLQQFGPFLKAFAHIFKSCIHDFQTIGT